MSSTIHILRHRARLSKYKLKLQKTIIPNWRSRVRQTNEQARSVIEANSSVLIMTAVNSLMLLLPLIQAITKTVPLSGKTSNFVDTLICAEVMEKKVVVDIPYGAYIFGYLTDGADTFGPVDYSVAGIYTDLGGDQNDLYGEETGGTTWTAEAVRPPGATGDTGHFGFCAQVSKLPASGQYVVQVQAVYDV